MESKNPKRNRVWSRRKTAILALLVAIQVGLSLGLSQVRSSAEYGYLVKSGPDYTVVWKEDGKFWQREFTDLDTALSFSKKSLALNTSTSVERSAQLERVWVKDRYGAYSLMWKRFGQPFLHQWTFSNEKEANFFYASFQSGAYSPSPYGHALMLSPPKF